MRIWGGGSPMCAGLIINLRLIWDIVPRYSSQSNIHLLLQVLLILKASSCACPAWPSTSIVCCCHNNCLTAESFQNYFSCSRVPRATIGMHHLFLFSKNRALLPCWYPARNQSLLIEEKCSSISISIGSSFFASSLFLYFYDWGLRSKKVWVKWLIVSLFYFVWEQHQAQLYIPQFKMMK